MRRACAVLLVFLAWLAPAAATAANASVDASVRSNVIEVRSNFRYVVSATVQGDEPIRVVKAPNFGPFKRIGQRRMPQLITINGATTRRLSVAYTLRAQKTGTFRIAPPTVQVGDERLQPKPVTVEVVARGKLPRKRPTSDGDRRYFIEVGVDPEEPPYVGEQVTLSWHLFVDGTRFDIRPTSTHDPSLDDFWVEAIPSNDQDRIVTYDGRLMRQIPLWRYAAFPLNSGPITLDPVEVEVVIGTFTRRESETVRSKPIELEVKPLPPDAPRGFDEGNVGVFNFSVRPEQNATRVGRALTVEVAVSGDGQLARVEVPDLPEIPRMRVSDVEEETKSRIRNGRVGGRRTKTVTLTPLKKGTVTIPSTRFVYFDTRQDEYVVRESEPVTIRVADGKAPPEPVEPSKLPTRNVSGGEDLVQSLIGDLRPPLAEVSIDAHADPARFPWPYWALAGLAFVIFLATAFLPRLEKLRRKNAPERRRKSATRQVFELLDEAGDDPGAIYAALRDWLSSAFDVPRGAVTASDLPRAFADRGLDEEVARRLAAVLEKCETARFAPDGADTSTLAEEAREVAEWLTKTGDVPRGVAVSLVTWSALLLVATSAWATPGLDSALAAQEAQDWSKAAEQWAQITEKHPDAVDAWYNLGTTAAQAEDWATARHALERAAYLAPLDSDVSHNRDIVARIVRLHAIERSRTGRTMDGDEMLFWWDIAAHVDPHVAGILLIVFWLLAAALVVVRRRTDSAAIRDAAFVGLVLSIVLGLTATFGAAARAHLLANTEAVVLVSEEFDLREGPNPAAKLKRIPTTLIPGTMLRATDRREGWVKLTWHDDAGWTTTDAVRSVR